MADPIRLPDGRTLGQVLYEEDRTQSSLVTWWEKPPALRAVCERQAQAVLAADPARAQARAALEHINAQLSVSSAGWALDLSRVAGDAIAALKGGGK